MTEEISGKKELRSLEEVNKLVLNGINGILSSGKVTEAYITQFLAV
jgi:hypothetical protein